MKSESGILIYCHTPWGSQDPCLTAYGDSYGFITSDSLSQFRETIINKIEYVGLSPNENVYFTPLCKIPRYKMDEYIQSNNLNITKCYMFKTAQKLILNKKHLTKLLAKSTKKYFKIPISDLYEKGPGISQYTNGKYVKYSRNAISSEYALLEVGRNNNNYTVEGFDCSQYPVIDAYIYGTQLESKEYKFLAEMGEAMKHYDFIIGEDDSVLHQTNKELIIDEDVYQSLRDMLSSGDYNNHNMAKELIANSNFKESEIYLLLLIHEFQRALMGGIKTPNYQVFLNKYSDWKLIAKRTDWFNYGLKLINKFPNDRDKIKGFMVTRFNKAARNEVLTDMIFKQ